MAKPVFPQVDLQTFLLPEPTMHAITQYVQTRLPAAEPEAIAAAVADYLDEHPIEQAPTVLVRRWAGGYASLPAERPVGLQTVQFLGSALPSAENVTGGLPGWLGEDVTSVLGSHTYWLE